MKRICRMIASAAARVVMLLLLVCGHLTAVANESESDQVVSIGWDGHYRVGKWVGVRIDPNKVEMSSEPTFVETRDGESGRVRFGGVVSANKPGTPREPWIYVVPGAEAAPLNVIRKGQVIARQRFPTGGSPSKRPSMIPRDMPWIFVLGDSLRIETIGANEILGRDSSVAVSTPTQPSVIPDSYLGYDGVDVIIVNSAGIPVLQGLNELQTDAIIEWVQAGGRFVVMLGADSKALLEAAPWIHRLLPFEVSETVQLSPSDFETFTTSQTPLDQFVGVLMPRKPGIQRLMGRTASRTSTPLAMEYRVGFGSVVAIAADLHSKPFVGWPDRMTLLTALVGPTMLPVDERQQAQNRSTSYDDLAGQTRASLDQFSRKKSFRFSVIALILMALIAFIGPLDYWLVNRWLGKPLLGWVTFPLVVMGLSGVLVWQANQTNPQEVASDTHAIPVAPHANRSPVEMKQMELIDLDSISGRGRGCSIHFAYTHDAQVFDLGLKTSQSFNSIASESIHRAELFGFPGPSYGGIQIASEDARLPAYHAASDQRLVKGGPAGVSDVPASRLITGLPLAPRSSKGILHSFRFNTDIGSGVQMERNPGSEYLKGELVNPLPFDVLDGFLVYGNWTYLLPTRWRSGDRIANLDTLRQKNFRFFLSRRQTIENASEGEAWKPGITKDWERLAQMLMFHDAAGGSQYTRLRNQMLDDLDLSDSLIADRCVLVGRLKSSLTSLDLSSNHASIDPDSETLSLIRVILPVVVTKFR